MATITSPAASASGTLTTNTWLIVDVSGPNTPPTEMLPVVTAYSGTVMEQSASHLPLGSTFPSIVADTVGGVGGSVTVETFTTADYQLLQSLTTAQRTMWISSPFGLGVYGRLGIPPNGMSAGGAGNAVRQAQLQPGSVASSPHHVTALTWIPQAKP